MWIKAFRALFYANFILYRVDAFYHSAISMHWRPKYYPQLLVDEF